MLQNALERLAGADQMILADEAAQITRADAFGERWLGMGHVSRQPGRKAQADSQSRLSRETWRRNDIAYSPQIAISFFANGISRASSPDNLHNLMQVIDIVISAQHQLVVEREAAAIGVPPGPLPERLVVRGQGGH